MLLALEHCRCYCCDSEFSVQNCGRWENIYLVRKDLTTFRSVCNIFHSYVQHVTGSISSTFLPAAVIVCQIVANPPGYKVIARHSFDLTFPSWLKMVSIFSMPTGSCYAFFGKYLFNSVVEQLPSIPRVLSSASSTTK